MGWKPVRHCLMPPARRPREDHEALRDRSYYSQGRLMRTELIAPTSSRHSALLPHASSARTGPVTVAVGYPAGETMRAGALVARQLGRGIAVISVIEPSAVYLWNSPAAPIPPEYEEQRTQARWHYLEDRMQAAAADAASWSIEVLWGGVPRTIARAARDLHAPLIVMGLSHQRPMERLLGGETVLRTIRQSDCPVLAVTPEFRALPRVVVAGTDFSDASAHAIRSAVPVLAQRVTLHLVHVWQPAARVTLGGAPYDERYRHELPARIQKFVRTLDLPDGIAVHLEVREGRPAEELLRIADERHADLLVVGRHGRGLVERLLVGSVASRVLRGAARSVLVVPEPPPAMRMSLAGRRGETARSVAREEWASFLEAFTRRYAGRVVSLDVSDPARALRTQDRGAMLFGASFDPAVNRVEIILGEAHGRRRHLTRVIPDATGVSALLGPTGDERGVLVVHGTGETLLHLLPIATQPKS